MDANAARPAELEINKDFLFSETFAHLSPQSITFSKSKIKQTNPRTCFEKKDQCCQSGEGETQTDDLDAAQTHCRSPKKKERLKKEPSRDEDIMHRLQQNIIYISFCVSPEVIIAHVHCFSEEQKSAVRAEANLMKASRKALDMLIHDVRDVGRFAALRDGLYTNDGYPKIVRILDGDYNPEDEQYIKLIDLFTREIIDRLEPLEIMLHLHRKQVFHQMDIQEIKAEETNHGKMRASCVLLMLLPRRTVDWFRSFIDALIKCDIDDIAEMLDPDLYKEIKQQHIGKKNRENPEKNDTLHCRHVNKIINTSRETPHRSNRPALQNISSSSETTTECVRQKNIGQSNLCRKFHNMESDNKQTVEPVLEEVEASTAKLCTAFQTMTLDSNMTEEPDLAHGQSESCTARSSVVEMCCKCKMACGRRLWVGKGSLVDHEVDVMVNPTNKRISFETGLSKDVGTKGGGTVKKACARVLQTHGSIDEGEVILTEAGDLPAKCLIHVNSPVWRNGEEGEERLLKQAVITAMIQASRKNAKSISLPAISSGTSGFTCRKATALIVQAIRNFFREEQESSITDVYLMDLRSDAVKRFRESLKTVFKDDPKCEVQEL